MVSEKTAELAVRDGAWYHLLHQHGDICSEHLTDNGGGDAGGGGRRSRARREQCGLSNKQGIRKKSEQNEALQ